MPLAMSLTTASKQAEDQLKQPAKNNPLSSSPSSSPSVSAWQLIGDGGLSNGLSLAITADRALIGRDKKCDLCLDSGHVDLVSASIQLIGDSIHLESQSIDPIYINNAPVEPAQTIILKTGDKISIDVFRLKLAHTANTQPNDSTEKSRPAASENQDYTNDVDSGDSILPPLLKTLALVIIIAAAASLAL